MSHEAARANFLDNPFRPPYLPRSLAAAPQFRPNQSIDRAKLGEESEAVLIMISTIKRFLTEETGQDVVEYSLMLVLIGAVVLIFLTGMGFNITGILSNIGNRLESVNDQVQ